MTRRTRVAIAVAGVAAVLAVISVLFMLRTRVLPRLDKSQVAHPMGAFHMHSADSHDSQVPFTTYVDTARQLGLDFIVLTDHNNQRPHAQTRDNVTVLSYAELSTPFGHVVQLGAPYTLELAQRRSTGVLAAIRTLGGAPIVTHPSDLKRPWSGSLTAAAGLEIANVAAAARRAARPIFLGLLPELIVWPLNPTLAMAQLYDRDTGALALWDEHPAPDVVGLCGTDAHGWIPPTINLQTWYVALDTALPEGDGRAAAIVDALRAGRFHCSAALLGHDPEFSFTAWHGGDSVGTAGDSVTQDKLDALSVTAPNSTGGVNQIILLRNGQEITRTTGRAMRYNQPVAGTYRVEIRALVPNLVFGERWVTVIYSNRLRVLPALPPPTMPLPPVAPLR